MGEGRFGFQSVVDGIPCPESVQTYIMHTLYLGLSWHARTVWCIYLRDVLEMIEK